MGDDSAGAINFSPALSVSEACTRIFSLTGASEQTARGEKRAMVALRDALRLDIETARTNADMGLKIANSLGVNWKPSYVTRTKVNLLGLNALLMGACSAYQQGALKDLAGNRPSGLTGSRWSKFQPATSKIEAVNRISALTNSGSERLGPGSKEHKRVLINLANGLAPHVDIQLSKSKLGASLAKEFDAPWDAKCESTGETISLQGLNTLLAGAERRLGSLGQNRAALFGTPEQEASMLINALIQGWPAQKLSDGTRRVHWDGRQAIEWMIKNGITNGPNQSEWQGFYWEIKGRLILNAAFSPNPQPPEIRFGHTPFDYSLNFVWDLKAHTNSWCDRDGNHLKNGGANAILNDVEAMDACVEKQGLGFLMVNGVAVADSDRTFINWHKELKVSNGVKTKASNSGKSRPRKSAFQPTEIEAIFFNNLPEFNAAKSAGVITGFTQGSQARTAQGSRGNPRRRKYQLNCNSPQLSPYIVAQQSW
jgi:hypothetical protein